MSLSDRQPTLTDEWSDWLLKARHADDPDLAHVVRADITKEADRVIDAAAVSAAMTIVDVGAGDGLVGLRAIERFGPQLQVTFTDISEPMLQYVKHAVSERGLQAQCRFVLGTAEDLRALGDDSADVILTRASLAYVADKHAALLEFRRILKRGGRISLAEPVLQDEAYMALALRRKLDLTPSRVRDPYMVWRHRCLAAQFPDSEAAIAQSPLTNFSERDLLRMVQSAGFTDIHMEVHFDIGPSKITCWDTFIGISPHPWAPPLKTVLARDFTESERRQFEQVTRPAVEEGKALVVGRALYLTANK